MLHRKQHEPHPLQRHTSLRTMAYLRHYMSHHTIPSVFLDESKHVKEEERYYPESRVSGAPTNLAIERDENW